MAVLNYILSHSENDERPYLKISILGIEVLGLLDSGATHTIIGNSGWKLLSVLNLALDATANLVVTVANGQQCSSIGSVNIPVAVEGRVKIIRALVIPTLEHSLILGVDFWHRMGIVPDLRRGSWRFSSCNPSFVDSILLTSQTELSMEQSKLLNELLDQEFRLLGDKLGCTSLVEHEIKTSSPPIKQRYYPVSPVMQGHIDAEVNKLLQEDIIERSTSPWSSPIVLVKKKNGSFRFCVDYRKLNGVTERDAYPIPYVSATLDKLRDAKYLSSLDIKSAYFQVPLSENSRALTAFTVPNRGLFQFKRLPMGLSNSPATFQRLIDRVLGPELEPYVFTYLDDIICVTPTFDLHLKILREIFRRLREANLTVAKEKCQFCRPELKYLGYVVDRHGLHVDPEKVSAIVNIPPPKSVSEVRRIIGMASWYRRFVPNFSTIVAPLTDLLRKNKPFVWDSACDEAFQTLKEHLVSAPILSCPDFSLPFTIQTDASGFGIGAVLSQQQAEGEKVICYLSRSLNRCERNYTTTERECLAVIWAIERLRPYIEGSKFFVITDHYSLVWLNRLESPVGRLARWAVRLQQYDYEIIHRKGKEHVVPDALSRSVPTLDSVMCGNTSSGESKQMVGLGDKWYDGMVSKISKTPHKFPMWQIFDGKLFKHVTPKYPELSGPSDYWRECVSRSNRKRLIQDTHTSSFHLGIYKTFHKLAQTYYWPKMHADVVEFVRRCRVCQSVKPVQKRPAGLMLSSQTAISRPFELLCADLMGPLPKSRTGHQYILVVADCFSKFALLFPLRQAKAPNIAKLIESEVFLLFGSPKTIIVDNGVQFKSREFVNLMKTYKVQIKYTPLYHPQANPCERINRVLKSMLRSFVSDDHRLWDQNLSKIGSVIRSTKHEVTGFTPNFIVFGREVASNGSLLTGDNPIQFNRDSINDKRSKAVEQLYQDVRLRLHRAYESSKKVYDLRRRDEQFFVNQLVWRRNYVLSDAAKYFTAKLAPKYVGPFLIAKRLSPWTYELKDSSDKYQGVWHVKDLKSHPPDTDGGGPV